MGENKKYVLCEFLNEDVKDNDGPDRPVQVAHADWIIFDGPNIPISTLIQEEREITIKWPKNYNVQPKEAMTKISTSIKWINTVAILKAQSNGKVEHFLSVLFLVVINLDLFCSENFIHILYLF